MLSMQLTFAPNSSDGAEMCTSVTILFDNVKEDDELFTVMLGLVSVPDSLRLGNAVTIVNLTDPTCMHTLSNKYTFLKLFSPQLNFQLPPLKSMLRLML